MKWEEVYRLVEKIYDDYSSVMDTTTRNAAMHWLRKHERDGGKAPDRIEPKRRKWIQLEWDEPRNTVTRLSIHSSRVAIHSRYADGYLVCENKIVLDRR